MDAKQFFSKAAAVAIVAIISLTGCVGKSEPSNEPTMIMAIDTSGSAAKDHGAIFAKCSDMIQAMPEGKSLFLYRFDSSPAEVYSQEPPTGSDDIAEILNKVLEHKSATKGTDLAKLFVLVDKRIQDLNVPVQVAVFTDCGT